MIETAIHPHILTPNIYFSIWLAHVGGRFNQPMKRVLSESNQKKLFYEWHVPQRNKVERLGLRKGCNLGMLLVQLFWKFNMANETKSTMSLNPGLGSFALWLFGSQIGVSNVIPGSQQGVTWGDRGWQEWLENAALPRQLLAAGKFYPKQKSPAFGHPIPPVGM